MRILDRYAVKQLIPVWIWCLIVFIFLSCLIDIFERLDDILRYRIPLRTLAQYYLNFIPFIFVKASPIALLLSGSFVASRLSRYQELLAMSASGTSLLRASIPFLFLGWLVSLAVFLVNDRVIPKTAVAYEQIKEAHFRGKKTDAPIHNVAVTDAFNRLYHARMLEVEQKELTELTILEHDLKNRPLKNLHAERAIETPHGWLLLNGTIYRLNAKGLLQGEPEFFVERLLSYPVTIDTFRNPQARPETMRFGHLRLLIARLKSINITNVREFQVALWSKLTMPLMNVIVCLLAFAGSTQPQLRGNLRGLGMSLGWGLLYYVGVGFGEGLAKSFYLAGVPWRGLQFPPVIVGALLPHALAVWWALRLLRRNP
ncbi:MAG: LptF/LptG family permease [Candidatus Omnitrophica bacterium]|nr:LptF/LptG family permease [Candidatus Omnitrophota bacterium]